MKVEREEEKEKLKEIVLNKNSDKELEKIELFKKHFSSFRKPGDMFDLLYDINHKEKNSELVSVINSALKDLEEEIKKMSENERKNEKSDEIVRIVKRILRFTNQKKKEQRLKILTPNQMLSRLPITLAQLKAGNNSEKLKNEIRQLLYSLCCSKNMTKHMYNNLINYI